MEQALNCLKSTDLVDAILISMAAKKPCFIWGDPGIGKSDIVRRVSKISGRPLLDFRLSQWDAVDSRGVPYTYTSEVSGQKRTGWAIPDIFPSDKDDKSIIFLDEFNTAKEAVQAAMYQLILDRRLGGYTLPEGVDIIAAGNKESNRAIVNKMGTALENRFAHLEMVVDLDEWVEWAIDADVDINVVIYLRNIQPDALHDWSPKAPTKGQPTPRSWEGVSNVLKIDPTLSKRRALQGLIAGLVGDGRCAEFMGYLDIAARMPDPDECINNPDSAPIPDDPTVTYALCGAIAARVNEHNVDGAYRYGDRLPAEFSSLLVVDSARRNPVVRTTRGYVNWSVKNGKEMMK